MRYDRESWRKLYREEPFEQSAWPVMARGIRDYLVRKPSDDDGTLVSRTADPVSDLLRLLGPTAGERKACREAIKLLIADGYLQHDADTGRLWIRRFKDAQTMRSKSAIRKEKQRKRERAEQAERDAAEAGQSRDSHNDQPVTVTTKNVTRSRAIDETRRDETRRDPPNPPTGGEGAQAGKPDGSAADVRCVFEAWKNDTGHHRAKLDRKREARIRARLREGFTVDQLIDAVTGRRFDPWLMGSDPKSTAVYDGIQTLFRDAEQVERLIELNRRGRLVPGGSNPNTFTPEELEEQRAARLAARKRDEAESSARRLAEIQRKAAERGVEIPDVVEPGGLFK